MAHEQRERSLDTTRELGSYGQRFRYRHPQGPESRYFAYLMGVRRNFVPRNWRAVPYFDVRLGVGNIDAKGPQGVLYAQGQDLTFTVNMGSGVRYNFNSRCALSAGLNFMHISNLD